MNELMPAIGQWYVRPDGLKFEVVDIDEEAGVVEVQSEDGTLDEIDAAAWPEIDVELTTQSEDAAAPFDNVPPPDEADGGDRVDPEKIDSEVISAEMSAEMVEPLRVSTEERVNSTDESDEVDDDKLNEEVEQPLSSLDSDSDSDSDSGSRSIK